MHKITMAEYERRINLLKQEYELKLQEQKDRIISLREENDNLKLKLNSYSIKDESISRALVLAVEKAKELENSSKNLYELEIQRIRILYSRWEKLLNLIIKKYPNVKAINEINNLITEFNQSIEQTINSNFVANPEQDKVYVKTLLTKMNGYVTSRTGGGVGVVPTKESEEEKQTTHQTTKLQEPTDIKHSERPSLLKPVSNLTLNQNDGYDNLVDKFLNENDGEELNTAYAKKFAPILNQRIEEKIENYMNSQKESGFDLGEAVRPKETLEEIMKAFDFYTDED